MYFTQQINEIVLLDVLGGTVLPSRPKLQEDEEKKDEYFKLRKIKTYNGERLVGN